MKKVMSAKPTPFTPANAAKPDPGVNSVRLRVAHFLLHIEEMLRAATFKVMDLRQRLDPQVWNRE